MSSSDFNAKLLDVLKNIGGYLLGIILVIVAGFFIFISPYFGIFSSAENHSIVHQYIRYMKELGDCEYNTEKFYFECQIDENIYYFKLIGWYAPREDDISEEEERFCSIDKGSSSVLVLNNFYESGDHVNSFCVKDSQDDPKNLLKLGRKLLDSKMEDGKLFWYFWLRHNPELLVLSYGSYPVRITEKGFEIYTEVEEIQ